MYLSSLQNGLQSAHVVGEMITKYLNHGLSDHQCDQHNMLLDWAENHKTMILLNAGYGANIHNLAEMFSSNHNTFPWAKFHEEQAALDGAITSIGIVLPEFVYRTASAIQNDHTRLGTIIHQNFIDWTDDSGTYFEFPITRWEITLAARLNDFRLSQ
jgi:hypothetical protein